MWSNEMSPIQSEGEQGVSRKADGMLSNRRLIMVYIRRQTDSQSRGESGLIRMFLRRELVSLYQGESGHPGVFTEGAGFPISG